MDSDTGAITSPRGSATTTPTQTTWPDSLLVCIYAAPRSYNVHNIPNTVEPLPKVPRTSLEILGFFKSNPRNSLVFQGTFGTGTHNVRVCLYIAYIACGSASLYIRPKKKSCLFPVTLP